MARIRLAHWRDGKAPGEVVEVPDEELKALVRDGRVAEVIEGDPQAGPAPEAAVDAPQPDGQVESGESTEGGGSRRKGRA
jgi:hypothetical protein